MMPKKTESLCVKITNYGAGKYWKKHVFKTSLRKNQTTIIPKKYRQIMIFFSNHPTRMPIYIEKTCTYGVTEVQSHYYAAQRIQIMYDFFFNNTNMIPEKINKIIFLRGRHGRITLLWCPKKQIFNVFFKHDTMIPKNIEKTCI